METNGSFGSHAALDRQVADEYQPMFWLQRVTKDMEENKTVEAFSCFFCFVFLIQICQK